MIMSRYCGAPSGHPGLRWPARARANGTPTDLTPLAAHASLAVHAPRFTRRARAPGAARGLGAPPIGPTSCFLSRSSCATTLHRPWTHNAGSPPHKARNRTSTGQLAPISAKEPRRPTAHFGFVAAWRRRHTKLRARPGVMGPDRLKCCRPDRFWCASERCGADSGEISKRPSPNRQSAFRANST